MSKSDQVNELAGALAKAQAKIKSAEKDVTNTFYKSQYAGLPKVWEACREALSSNGLSVVQCTDAGENGMVLESILLHSSGQWISSLYPINPVKQDPQGLGSALTYARRYSLMSLVGVVADDASDDDGNVASGKPEGQTWTKATLSASENDPKLPSRREHFKAEGLEAAQGGTEVLKVWWGQLQDSEKRTLAIYKDTVLKDVAQKADAEPVS